MNIIFFTTCLSFLFTTSAQAYIDPGTFSIIFQAIIGAIVAGGVAIKIYWNRLLSIFKKRDKNEKKSN